jgi:hypothetical protein
MDADRFDRLARSLITPSRRVFGRGLAGLTLAGGAHLVPNLPTIDARRKKKNKKCKGKTRKCKNTCIPKAQCCTILDCGQAEDCINGQCACLDGFRPCGDTCILDDRFSCCDDTECGVIEGFEYDVCVDHDCKCSGFHCDGPECCAVGEVCNNDTRLCEPGPCPNVQICDRTDSIYKCGHGSGYCTTTASGGPVCIDGFSEVCMACDSDTDCAGELGPGAVCVTPGACSCGGTPHTSYCARTIPV